MGFPKLTEQGHIFVFLESKHVRVYTGHFKDMLSHNTLLKGKT